VEFSGTRVIVADGMTFAGKCAALTTFDLSTGLVQTLFEVEGDLGISSLLILPEDELLIVAIDDMRFPKHPEIRCLTIEGTERARYRPNIFLYDLAAWDNQSIVMTGASDYGGRSEVFVLEAASGQAKARRVLGPEIGACVVGSPILDRLAIAYGCNVELCKPESLEPELRIRLMDEHVCSVAWSPDGSWIAVGTNERTVRLFDAATGREYLVPFTFRSL
jgi:hypothetical protein